MASAEQKDVPLEIASVGRVEAISTVSVKAQVGGEVMAVYFKEGQDRAEGRPPVHDRPAALRDRPEAGRVPAREGPGPAEERRGRRRPLRRARPEGLRDQGAVRRARRQPRRSRRPPIKADEADVANARLQLEYATVRSPIDGRTGSLLIDPGNIIKANDTTPPWSSTRSARSTSPSPSPSRTCPGSRSSWPRRRSRRRPFPQATDRRRSPAS